MERSLFSPNNKAMQLNMNNYFLFKGKVDLDSVTSFLQIQLTAVLYWVSSVTFDFSSLTELSQKSQFCLE